MYACNTKRLLQNLSIDLHDDEIKSVEGNLTRDLWKLCTWQLASDVS